MKILKKWLITLSAIVSVETMAWDGSVEGKIQNIDVAPGENYGFRLSLQNLPKLCGNDHVWAYLNESDSNYKTFVSVLLAAKMAEKNVRIFTTKETTSGNSYCRIGYVVLR